MPHEKGGFQTAQGKQALPVKTTSGRLSYDNSQIQFITEAAAERIASVPYWAESLPVPPEYDFLADVEQDRKLVAVMCAITRIAKQRGETFESQVAIWKGVIDVACT